MTDRQDLINYIINYLDNTDYHIAKFVSKIIENRYCLTTENNKDKWFKYNGEHWMSSNTIIHELNILLSSEIASYIADARTELRRRICDCLDENNISFEKERLIQLFKIEKELYNSRRKHSILKECECILYKERLPEIKST
jgi:hypothetical protein